MAFMPLPIASGAFLDEFGVFRISQRAFVNATASGNTVIVAAQGTGIRIRVLAINAISLTALNIKFQSNTTDICSSKPVAATGGYVAPQADAGWFQTAPNEALNVNLSGAGTVGVDVVWVQTGA